MMFALLIALAFTTNCGPRQDILDFLQNNYGEVVVSSAVHSRGTKEEVVNKETGTWSTLWTVPFRPTCIVASGTDWQAVVPKEVLGGEDA